jgi:hypothetical protein
VRALEVKLLAGLEESPQEIEAYLASVDKVTGVSASPYAQITTIQQPPIPHHDKDNP